MIRENQENGKSTKKTSCKKKLIRENMRIIKTCVDHRHGNNLFGLFIFFLILNKCFRYINIRLSNL